MGALLGPSVCLLVSHAANPEREEGKLHTAKGHECKTANRRVEIKTRVSDLSKVGPQWRVNPEGTALLQFGPWGVTCQCHHLPSLPDPPSPSHERICLTQKQDNKAIMVLFPELRKISQIYYWYLGGKGDLAGASKSGGVC